jgi:hypothetical protein
MASGVAVASSSPSDLDDEPVPVEQDDLVGLTGDRQQLGLDLGPQPPVLGVGQVAPLVLFPELLHAGPEAPALLVAGPRGGSGEATPQLGPALLDGVGRQDGGHEPLDDDSFGLPARDAALVKLDGDGRPGGQRPARASTA